MQKGFGQGRGVAGGDAIFRSFGEKNPVSGSVVGCKQAHQGWGGLGTAFPLQEVALQSAVTSKGSPGSQPVPWTALEPKGLGSVRVREG